MRKPAAVRRFASRFPHESDAAGRPCGPAAAAHSQGASLPARQFRCQPGGVRVVLTRLAAGRDGLLTGADLAALGVSPDMLRGWLRRGRLRALHRGVYAPPGLVLTPRVAARAATLAAGLPLATPSYQTAAGVHGLGVLVLAGPAHVTVPADKCRRNRSGLVVHRQNLADGDVVDLDGLPVTAAPRTVLDLLSGPSRLAAVWAGDAAIRAMAVTEAALDDSIRCRSHRPYVARMRRWRALMDPRSESPLETAIRLVLHDAGVPPPVPQHEVRTPDGHLLARIDLAWPAHRLGLEADGKSVHGKLQPAYTDRWRTNALVGWRVIRFTWYDVLRRPAYVVATVRAQLAAPA